MMNSVLYWRNASSFNLMIHEWEVNRTTTHLFFTMLINPTKQLKLTLVWTDPPASTFSSTVMVNDLDLTVDYNGTIYYPNK